MILVADEPEYYDGYEDGALKAIEIIKEEFGLKLRFSGGNASNESI